MRGVIRDRAPLFPDSFYYIFYLSIWEARNERGRDAARPCLFGS